MHISFKGIVQIYLVILMIFSLLLITDRLIARSSRPVFIGDQFSQVVIVMKKGCIFPAHWEKL